MERFGSVGRYLVMCCNCSRLMGVDGQPVKFRPGTTCTPELFAAFDERADCDQAAKRAGWKVENENHRCPVCKSLERMLPGADSGRQGGYVDRATLFAK